MELENLFPEFKVKAPRNAIRWVKGDIKLTIQHYCGGTSVTVNKVHRDDLISTAQLVEFVNQTLK